MGASPVMNSQEAGALLELHCEGPIEEGKQKASVQVSVRAICSSDSLKATALARAALGTSSSLHAQLLDAEIRDLCCSKMWAGSNAGDGA